MASWPGMEGRIQPMWRIPIVDRFDLVSNWQGTPCGFFEKNFWKCVEAYGSMHAKRFCDLEYRDFRECLYHKKSQQRYHAIRRERMRQFLEGKRDRPYEETAPIGVFFQDFFSNNDLYS